MLHTPYPFASPLRVTKAWGWQEYLTWYLIRNSKEHTGSCVVHFWGVMDNFLSIHWSSHGILRHAILVSSGDDFLRGAKSLHGIDRRAFLVSSRIISSGRVLNGWKELWRLATFLDLVESQEKGGRVKDLQREVNSGEIQPYCFLLAGSNGGSSSWRIVGMHR